MSLREAPTDDGADVEEEANVVIGRPLVGTDPIPERSRRGPLEMCAGGCGAYAGELPDMAATAGPLREAVQEAWCDGCVRRCDDGFAVPSR